MPDHPNVAKIREGYEAFAAGDIEKAASTWADGIIWHALGNSKISGDYKGQEEVFGFFGKLLELAGAEMIIDVHDVLANDMHGTALVKFSANRDGKPYEMNEVHVFHFEDGLVTEFWAFEEDQRRSEEFFS